METKLLLDGSVHATDSHASSTQIEPRVAQALEARKIWAADFNAFTAQIEPRVAQVLEAMGPQQVLETSVQATHSHASSTKIEPRVAQALEAREIRTVDSHAFTARIEPRVSETAAVDVGAQEQTAADEAPELQDLAAALTKVSLSAPEARISIVYPRGSGQDLSKDPAVICLPQILGDLQPFGVMQTAEYAAFTFKIPFYKWTFKNPSPRMLSREPRCQLIYDPRSNICYLVHFVIALGVEMWVINADDPSSRKSLAHMQPLELTPGVWRVLASVESEDHSRDHHLVDILVLERYFNVSIRQKHSSISMKRGAIEDIEHVERSAKRQKDGTASREVIIAPAAGKLSSQLEHTADNRNETCTPHDVVNIITGTDSTIMDLNDGDTAIIKTTIKGEKNSYQLQRTKNILKNRATSVFTCHHSIVSETIVAKVLCYDSKNVVGVAKSWKQEKTLLEKLDHKNIVKLKAVDGRMFAIYLELLPSSLNLGIKSPLYPSDALKILHDVSSALAYLAAQGIYHNDIKPGNIAYSRSRGAVLLDFGLASTLTTVGGGTPFYIPPELMNGKRRDAAGDVWALGVTMLYVLGIMPFPDREQGWLIHEAATRGTDAHKQMEKWIDRIAEHRSKLNREDKVESLVFQMLCRDTASRVKAEVIESALKGCRELE